MAVAAVLQDRRMLPEEWPTPLRMAHVTGLINACLLELGRVGGAVGIVAVGAGELPFSQRHVRTALERGLSL